jgi:hypothetical protein
MHINKCAGSSMEVSLKAWSFPSYKRSLPKKPRFPFIHTQHLNMIEYKKWLGEKDFNNRFKFTFVRNPWDRVLSNYTVQFRTKKDFKFLNFNNWLLKAFDTGDVRPLICRYDGCNHTRFISPCLDWIMDEDNNIAVDFIGRFENLQEDWDKVVNQLPHGKDIPALLHRKDSHRKLHYREIYNDESKRIVEQHFQKDIEYFGYEY